MTPPPPVYLPQKLLGAYAPSTLGNLRAQLNTPSFRITEAEYEPGEKFGTHAHEHASITAVIQGGFTECFRGDNLACTARSILIKPAAELHSNVYGEVPTKCLLVAVLRPSAFLPSLFERTIQTRDAFSYSLALAIRDEITVRDEVAPAAAEGLVLELLSRTFRRTRDNHHETVPAWLTRLRRELQSRCREKLGMDDIAELTGFHPVYAARAFRRYFGCAPMQYVRRCRLDWAARALVETSLSICEISIAAGFSDQSHFTKAFTQAIGRTPGSVRRGAPAERGADGES